MNKAFGLGFLLLGSVLPATGWAGVPEDNRLLEAVRNNDHAAIKSSLKDRANPNAPLPDNATVLSWAVDRQDVEAVDMLLAAGAKPNVTDINGASPLTLACEGGNSQIVASLLKAGADAKAARADGISALALCAGMASPEAVAGLVAKGANANAVDQSGQTPLMWAAAKGRADNIGVLVKSGANVNAVSKKGFTPVFFALQSHKADASLALLDAGADANAVLPDGTTVIAAAITLKNIPFATQIVARGADVNKRDARGWQLIHVAAASGDANLVKMVLSKGGNANAVTQPPAEKPVEVASAAPVQIALAGGSAPKKRPLEAFEYLLPPPAAATPALLLAAGSGSVEAMKVLIEAGADTKAKGADGLTLALASARGGSLEALKYAVNIDPNINVLAQGGRSIMHMVVENRTSTEYEPMILFLADKGAELNVVDERRVSPGSFVNRVGPEKLRVFYIQLLKDRKVNTARAPDEAGPFLGEGPKTKGGKPKAAAKDGKIPG